MKVPRKALTPASINPASIAPCGMDCCLCRAYGRERNRCTGCRTEPTGRMAHLTTCRIRNCAKLKSSGEPFCLSCPDFPCPEIKRIDTRYRTKYGMSMRENLDTIREKGLEYFVSHEKTRWKCNNCGNLICVHRPACIYCGHERQ